jgi:arylsulfatase A-like enzyme
MSDQPAAPTRSGLMTGHYANSTGVWHTIGGRSLLRVDEYTLANMFADAGYATGMFGKWHLGDNFPHQRPVATRQRRLAPILGPGVVIGSENSAILLVQRI